VQQNKVNSTTNCHCSIAVDAAYPSADA